MRIDGTTRETRTKKFCIFTIFLFCRGVCIQHTKKRKKKTGRLSIIFSNRYVTRNTQTTDNYMNQGSGFGDNTKMEMGKQEADLKKKLPIRRRLCNSITLLNIEFIFFAILCFFNVVVGLCRFQCTNTV